MLLYYSNNASRPGCKDIWNAFMVDGASFGKYDIPFCPTTATCIPVHQATCIPVHQATWEEAKQIHRKHISKKEYDYHEDAFVNWY